MHIPVARLSSTPKLTSPHAGGKLVSRNASHSAAVAGLAAIATPSHPAKGAIGDGGGGGGEQDATHSLC